MNMAIILLITLTFVIIFITSIKLKSGNSSITSNSERDFITDNFYIPVDDIEDYEKDMPEGIGCETIYDNKYFILFYQEDDFCNVILRFVFREVNLESLNFVKQTIPHIIDYDIENSYLEKFKEEDYIDKNLVITEKEDGSLVVTYEGSNREYFDLYPHLIVPRSIK